MRCLVASSFGLALVVTVCGCRSCDHVESELRARENDVRELRDEVDRCSIYNQTLQHELRSLRGELGLPSADGQPAVAYPVQTLVLGRQTGGRSNENCPGDDALQVQVEPRDPEGQSIKAPGSLLVQVQEITKEGTKRPLSSWEIPQEKLRRSWRNGLLTTGYVVNLPWKVWPSTEKLRVSAVLQLPDGRVFEADKDITVRLTPVNRRPAVVPDAKPAPAPPSAGPGGPVLLPTPHLIDPAKPAKSLPSETTPGPFLGVTRETTVAPNSWQKVDPPPPPPASEILRPVPLKR
ncbi:MAG TPA: hypothetical protein VN688_01625 [Gemmataceae bacterium]|nr:hypothetical protein [Gemmataceae bacterium]